MAKKIYVGVGDKARNVKALYVGVNNVARKVKKAYVGVNNLARLCWENGPIGTPVSIPRMTSDTAPSGTVTYSGTLNGDMRYAGWHAFRYSDSEYWQPRSGMHTYKNPWLMYDFGYLVNPVNISFRANSNKAVTWYFEGSADNTNWVTLTSFPFPSDAVFHDYGITFSTSEMYRYFRIRCVYGSPGYNILFSQCYLNGLRY